MSFAHNTFCVLVSLFFIYFFGIAATCQQCTTCCTFLSCTVLLILIFKSTVYSHAHYLYFILYILFFYSFHFMYILCVVFYNICTVHGADLTHISLLVYTLCIIVYVTNKSWTWNFRSTLLFCVHDMTGWLTHMLGRAPHWCLCWWWWPLSLPQLSPHLHLWPTGPELHYYRPPPLTSPPYDCPLVSQRSAWDGTFISTDRLLCYDTVDKWNVSWF